MIKTKRQVVEELLIEYVNLTNRDEQLRQIGVRVDFFKYDYLHDWALDLVGFPSDTTLDPDDDFNPFSFCRDYLLGDLIDIAKVKDVNLAVSEYTDWLYQEYQEYVDDKPRHCIS